MTDPDHVLARLDKAERFAAELDAALKHALTVVFAHDSTIARLESELITLRADLRRMAPVVGVCVSECQQGARP